MSHKDFDPVLLQTLTTTARVLEDAARQLHAVVSALQSPRTEEARARCDRCGEWVPFQRAFLRPGGPMVTGPECVCVPCLDDERNEEMARANAGIDARREDDACERAAGRDE